MVYLARIGDIVLSCPTTRALKLAYPHAEIDMLVSMPQGEAAFHNPYINKVIPYDIKDWQQDRVKLISLIETLRQQKYDLALSSRYGSANPMIAWLSGAVYRAGFSAYAGDRYLTHVVSTDPSIIRHEVDNQLQVLSLLGITTDDTSIEFSISSADETGLNRKLPSLARNQRPLVLLCPFSNDDQKNWTHDGYTYILQTLSRRTKCFLIGTRAQLPALRFLNYCVSNEAIVLGGSLSLGELAALIRRADLLITVDTGPMHIAQAFQTPVLALMGPTDPRVWGPRKSCDVVIAKPTPCAPCWHNEDLKNNCPNNKCMQSIQPIDVLNAAQRILSL